MEAHPFTLAGAPLFGVRPSAQHRTASHLPRARRSSRTLGLTLTPAQLSIALPPSPSSQTAFRFRLDSKFRPHPSAFVADPSSSARENNPPLQLLAGRLLSPSTFSTLFRPTTIVPISLLYVAAASPNQPYLRALSLDHASIPPTIYPILSCETTSYPASITIP